MKLVVIFEALCLLLMLQCIDAEAHNLQKRSENSNELQQKDLKIESLEKELEKTNEELRKAYERINSIYEQIDRREEDIDKRQEDYEQKIVRMQEEKNATQELHQVKLQICKERSSESQTKAAKLEGEIQKMTVEKQNCEERLLSSTGDNSKNDEIQRILNSCRQNLATSTANLNTANQKVSTVQSEMTTLQHNHNSALTACQDETSRQRSKVSSLEATNQQIRNEKFELENKVATVSTGGSSLDKFFAFFNKPETPKNCPTLYTSKFTECVGRDVETLAARFRVLKYSNCCSFSP
jgi:chromosome segregation ATPase